MLWHRRIHTQIHTYTYCKYIKKRNLTGRMFCNFRGLLTNDVARLTANTIGKVFFSVSKLYKEQVNGAT